MKAQIENLKALIHGKELTNYQRALALNEWSKLIAHIEELEQLATPAVMGELTCDSCGCHPNVIYTTSKGRFCEKCKPAS